MTAGEWWGIWVRSLFGGPPAPTPGPSPSPTTIALGGTIVVLSGVAVFLGLRALSDKPAPPLVPTLSVDAPPDHVKPSAPPKKTVPLTADQMFAASKCGDSSGAIHGCVAAFGAWAANFMVMDDVDPEIHGATTYEKAARDSDVERGRRLCFRGVVLQIAGETFAGKRVFTADMFDASQRSIRVLAVGDATDIFDGTDAHFCGMFVGRESFENLEHTQTKSIRLVGMFLTRANIATSVHVESQPVAPQRGPAPKPAPPKPAANCSPPFTMVDGKKTLKVECL